MPIKKFLKRAVPKAKKYVKKRYGLNKASSGIKYGQMARDMLMLKQMVNAEKQFFTNGNNINLGQVNVNAVGASCTDITPLIPQGDSRKGLSVKLHSSLYQFQFKQQANATLANKIIVEFWVNKGQPQTTATLLEQVFATSTFSGTIDSNSARNQDRFSDYQLIRRVIKRMPADPNTGDAPVLTFQVPIKYNRGKGHHIRLVSSISGTPVNDITNGQIFMTMRCEHGNYGSTVSTKDISILTAETGMACRFAYKTWYYDN